MNYYQVFLEEGLRTLDAIQLSSVLTLKKQEVYFFTADNLRIKIEKTTEKFTFKINYFSLFIIALLILVIE